MSIRKLAFCAMCIALAAVASLIRIYRFPFGGSVTFFSMLFIMLPSWFYGVRYGALCGLAFGLIQFMLDPCMISIPQVLLDYVLAFTVMAVAGFFKNKKNSLIIGYSTAIFARWIIATLAGLAWVSAGSTAWNGWSPVPYSMVYNAAYIFTEGIITIAILLVPPVRKSLLRVKAEALKG